MMLVLGVIPSIRILESVSTAKIPTMKYNSVSVLIEPVLLAKSHTQGSASIGTVQTGMNTTGSAETVGLERPGI